MAGLGATAIHRNADGAEMTLPDLLRAHFLFPP